MTPHVLVVPQSTSWGEEVQTLVGEDSWMAHCLPPSGLCHRQKNQGLSEEQDSRTWEPSVMRLPEVGELDMIFKELTVTVDTRVVKRVRKSAHIAVLKVSGTLLFEAPD